MADLGCPACLKHSGDDWRQCERFGACPMRGAPLHCPVLEATLLPYAGPDEGEDEVGDGPEAEALRELLCFADRAVAEVDGRADAGRQAAMWRLAREIERRLAARRRTDAGDG